MNEQIIDKIYQLTDGEITRDKIEQVFSSLSQDEEREFVALIQQQAVDNPGMAKMFVWGMFVRSGISKKGLRLLYDEKRPGDALTEFKKALPYLEHTDPETQYGVYAYMVLAYNAKYEDAPSNYPGGGKAPQEEFAEIWNAFKKVEEIWPECERLNPPENLRGLHESLLDLKPHYLYEALIRLEGYKEPEEISQMKFNNPESALEELKKWFAYKDEFERIKTSASAQVIVFRLCFECLAACGLAYGEEPSNYPDEYFNYAWEAIQSARRILNEYQQEVMRMPSGGMSAEETRQLIESSYQALSSEYYRRRGETPPRPQTQAQQSSGPCFIATAVYDSESAPEVLALRAFRDDALLPSKLGRALVNFYYLISPPAARLLRANSLLRNTVRKVFLAPIANLVWSKLQ